MKNQKGSVMTVVFIVLAILSVLISIPIIWGVSVRNTLNHFENKIDAVDKDMQNVHASMFAQMRQQGIVVEKYKDIVIEALEATFGKGGSRAAFQWLQSQGTIPPEVLDKMQVAIEAGYNRFEATQRTKLDVVRVYKDFAQDYPKKFIADFSGYPTKPWDELGRIVTSAQTKKDFESGELSDPGLFDKKK